MDKKEFLTKLGLSIRKKREKKGVSLNKFALDNEITKSALSKIENGLSNPQIVTLNKITDGLNINLKNLFDFD